MDKQQQIHVSDAEIQKIIEENEAGTADVMAIYEAAETSYMAALNVGGRGLVAPASTDTAISR